ncbi:hypothetical protein HDU98_011998 [Podochytrium sp. JEL0797]|nr:hypothetical protein HDU98_011998 [Podochytrium sp. JEL0797]
MKSGGGAANGGNESDTDLDEPDEGRTVSHADFQYAHRLILEMNASCRGILLNVIPLFEDQLKCEDEKVRHLSTDVLGKIFVDSGSRVAVVYPAVWRVWLERRNDKNAGIRILWVNFCNEVYRHHPELSADISAGLEQKFFDPDDKVRFAVIRVMSMLDYVSLINFPREVLMHLADRCKDKKMPCRIEAIKALGNIFKLTYNDIVSDENQASTKYGWIPGCLLELMYIGDIETGIVMERALHEDIFPYTQDDAQRTDRLLRVMGGLTERQYKAFLSMIDRQASMIKDFSLMIDLCEEWNGGILDNDDGTVESKLNRLILHIASKFSDSKKAATALQKFAKNNENRTYKLFKGIMSETADFKTISKNGKEIIKRLEPHAGLPETFHMILRRVSLAILGKSSIPRLIEVAQSSSMRGNASVGDISIANTTVDNELARLAATAEGLIKKLASTFPGVYGSHLEEFLKLLVAGDEGLVSDSLEGLSKFVKTFPKDLKLTVAQQQIVKGYALHGTVRQAKHAGTILALLNDPTPRQDIIDRLMSVFRTPGLVSKCIHEFDASQALKNEEGEEAMQDSFTMDEMPLIKLPTWFSTLGQLLLYAPREDLDLVEGVLSDVVLKDVLGRGYSGDPHDEEEWVDMDSLHVEGVLKVLGVKMLVNHVRGLEGLEEVKVRAAPVYRMLMTIVEKEGEIVVPAKGVTCNAFKSHLRQVATLSMLKLARIPACDALLTTMDRGRLLSTIQDPCWQTRDAFVERLRKYLQTRVIHYQYVVLLCMAALEPDDDIRLKVGLVSAKSFLSRFAKAPKDDNASTMESVFVNVLHMVAHHPDFGFDYDDISLSAQYIQFYLDIVATADNASFLFHSAAQLKTLVDLHAATSENIYHISDLAQFLIQEQCKQNLWTLNSYPDVIPYKRDLFKKQANAQLSNENVKKSYLSKKWMEGTQSANLLVKAKPGSRRKSSLGRAEREKLAQESEEEGDANEDDPDEEDDAPKKKRAPRKRKTSGGSTTTTTPRKKSVGTPAKKRKSDASVEEEGGVTPRFEC